MSRTKYVVDTEGLLRETEKAVCRFASHLLADQAHTFVMDVRRLKVLVRLFNGVASSGVKVSGFGSVMS